MKMYNVAIVDDHLLFAEGIGKIVCEQPEFKLVFISSKTSDLIEKIEREKVNILILDINISSEVNGIVMMEKIKNAYGSKIKIMLLSMYQPIDLGLDLTAYIGDAYVLKTSGKAILKDALHSMINEEVYFDVHINDSIPIRDSFTTGLSLTKREKEIAALLSAGKTSKEIAGILFISEHTVKTHRKNISEKLKTNE
jgi:DNA-binding NarL/FixJ family response regulator